MGCSSQPLLPGYILYFTSFFTPLRPTWGLIFCKVPVPYLPNPYGQGSCQQNGKRQQPFLGPKDRRPHWQDLSIRSQAQFRQQQPDKENRHQEQHSQSECAQPCQQLPASPGRNCGINSCPWALYLFILSLLRYQMPSQESTAYTFHFRIWEWNLSVPPVPDVQGDGRPQNTW